MPLKWALHTCPNSDWIIKPHRKINKGGRETGEQNSITNPCSVWYPIQIIGIMGKKRAGTQNSHTVSSSLWLTDNRMFGVWGGGGGKPFSGTNHSGAHNYWVILVLIQQADLTSGRCFYTIGLTIQVLRYPMSQNVNAFFPICTDKKKIQFSSYIRKFSRDRMQSHICETYLFHKILVEKCCSRRSLGV